MPEDIVRRAVELYDLESYSQRSEEVIDEVEQMLGMKEIQWPSPSFRLQMIRRKLEVSIKEILRSHGRVHFYFYNIESLLMSLTGIQSLGTRIRKKARLKVAPPPGKELPLPEWLQNPYIVLTKGYPSRLVFDSCANPTTRTDDALYDQAERFVGTLGTVMSSPQAGRADAEVVLTAGHVIPDGDDRLLVKNRKLDTFVSLRVTPKFRRFNNRPLHRWNIRPSFKMTSAFYS